MKLKQNKKVQFDELTHSYFYGEGELMGVTTLMKKHGLSADYTGISQAVLEKAAERGTAVHHILEDYDAGKTTIAGEFEDELKAYSKLGLKVIQSEYLVSDNKLVASSIDKVIEVEEENMVDLGDVKTTSKLHIEALEWQLGIYKYLFELQNKKIKVRKCWGIHVRDGKAVLREINPVSSEMVQDLLKCEAGGILYQKQGELNMEAVSLVDREEVMAYTSALQAMAELDAQLKALKEVKDKFENDLYEKMLEKNIDKLEYPEGVITLKRPYTKQAIDSKALKAKRPEVYEEFLKETTVKGNITFKSTQYE